MKLFVAYIGGETGRSNIELHDLRFSVGEKIEDCYDDIRAQWWGTPESLHLDAWGALESVNDYNIVLKSEPYEGEDRLFFVNLGGYDSNQFTELHSNIFVAATSDSKAKVKALKTILDWESHHRDYQYDVEKILCVNTIVQEKGLHIHLEKTDSPKPFQFTCRYNPIAKTDS